MGFLLLVSSTGFSLAGSALLDLFLRGSMNHSKQRASTAVQGIKVGWRLDSTTQLQVIDDRAKVNQLGGDMRR